MCVCVFVRVMTTLAPSCIDIEVSVVGTVTVICHMAICGT